MLFYSVVLFESHHFVIYKDCIMLYRYINLPVGVFPFERSTNIAPIAAAAIAGGASLLGGLFSGLSGSSSSKAMLQAQRETNETNKQIAREVNQANLDLYREQYQDSIKQWQMENQYNDPSAQVARLRAAGLNPSMAFGGDNIAGSISLPSASPAVGYEHQMAPTEAYTDSFINGFIQSLPNVSAAVGQTVDSQSQIMDNQMKNAYHRAELNNIEADTNSKVADVQYKLSQKGLSEQQRKNLRQELANLRSTKKGIDFMNRLNGQQYEDLVQSAKLNNDFVKQQMTSLKERTAQDAARLAIEQYEAETHRRMSAAQIANLNVISRVALNTDWRASKMHEQDLFLKQLDESLKRVELNEKQKQQIFNDIMRNTDLYHEGLKDASEINRIVERVFGLGFRDVGAALQNLVKAAK